jgi:TolB protein
MSRVVAALAVAAVTAAAAAAGGLAQTGPGEIVFVASARSSAPHSVFAVHADGGSLRRLPLGHARAAYWSPNGKRVALVGTSLTLRDSDGGHRATVVECGAGCDVAWAPGGQRLAYTVIDRCSQSLCPARLGIVRANGSGRRTLLQFAGARVTSPSWSPDGSLIAFVESASGVADLDVVRPNGRGFTRLAPIDGSAYFPQYHPSWSAGSGAILFSASRAGAVRVLSVARDGRELRTLAVGSFPVVSPDGRRIAFVRNGQAYVMPAGGGKETKVGSGAVSPVAWSLDGSRLAYVVKGRKIAVAQADGSGTRTVTPSYGDATTVDWRPL